MKARTIMDVSGMKETEEHKFPVSDFVFVEVDRDMSRAEIDAEVLDLMEDYRDEFGVSSPKEFVEWMNEETRFSAAILNPITHTHRLEFRDGSGVEGDTE